MSVPKSKRSQSSIEFEMMYMRVADEVDEIIERGFCVKQDVAIANSLFIRARSAMLSKLSDELLYHIKIANSIYPTCMTEYEERRLEIGKAVGTCYAILATYQRVMIRLRIRDDRYTQPVHDLVHLINSLKTWRKSDNKIKERLLKEKHE